MEKERIYEVTKDADGVIRVGMAGDEVVSLGGHTSLLIYMTWINFCGQGDHRADDYIAGIVQGLTYCAINGAPTSSGEIAPRNHAGEPTPKEGETKVPAASTGGTLSLGGALSVVGEDGKEKV